MARLKHIRISYREIMMEVLGSFMVAIGIYNFALMSEFPMTGFSGIALIFYRLFGLPIGVTTVVLNIPVAFLCYRLLGRGFFLCSVRCIIISSFIIDFIAPLFPVYRGDRLLSAICTGVIAGAGYALIYMQNSSTGGTDFIVMSAKALKPHLSLGLLTFLPDVGIILAGGIIFHDTDGIIYGMIINFLFAFAVNKIMYGINSGKLTLIVTQSGGEVADRIEECCGRGSTIIKALGGYMKEEKDVVMCACNNKQMYLVQNAVKELDPDAFIVILESNEVHGEGFKPLIIGEREKKR